MQGKETVLLVEDDDTILWATKGALELEGFTVHPAASIAQARAVLAELTPDAILLDVGLPDGSGVASCRELRTLHQYKRPIFLQSTLDTKADIIAGYEAGCLDYLVKPVNLTILPLKLRGYLAVCGN